MVATDIADNVFVTNNDSSSQTYENGLGFAFDGAPLFATAQDTTLHLEKFISMDGLGHVLLANNSTNANQVVKVLSSSTGALLTTVKTAIATLFGVFADPFHNIWYTSSAAAVTNIGELRYTGNDANGNPTYSEVTFSPAPQAAEGLYQIALDSQLNVWTLGSSTSGSAGYLLANTGTVAAPTYTAALGSAATMGSTANGYPDSNDNAWLITGGGFFKITKTGTGAAATLAAGSNVYSGASYVRYAAVDGLNTVFTADNNNAASTSGVAYYDTTGGLALA